MTTRRPLSIVRVGAGLALLGVLACAPAGPTNQAPIQPGTAGASGQAAADAPAAPASPPPALQSVTVAIVSPTEVFAVPWIGKDRGIFRKHGFDVEVP